MGLFSGLILIIIGITGSVLSFEQEVLAYLNKHTYTIPVSDKEKISLNKILINYTQKNENLKINTIKFSNINNKSLSISSVDIITNEKFTHYLNPHTLKFLQKERGVSFFRTIESIHRTLLLKDVGKNIVGISVVIFLILIFSGIYILLIKFKKNLSKIFYIDRKRKGKQLLSNIHGSIGIFIFPFYLVSILSGLNWSYPFYNDTLHKLLEIDTPKRTITKVDSKQTKQSIENIINAIVLFNKEVPQKYAYSVLKMPVSGSFYSFLYMDENANHRRERNKLLLDVKSQRIIKHERFEDKALKEQIMISMLTIHTGEYFGIFGKIVMFIISLLLPILCMSGIILYMKKRKIKK